MLKSQTNSMIFTIFINFFNFKMRLSQNYHFRDSNLLLSTYDIITGWIHGNGNNNTATTMAVWQTKYEEY